MTKDTIFRDYSMTKPRVASLSKYEGHASLLVAFGVVVLHECSRGSESSCKFTDLPEGEATCFGSLIKP